MEELEKEIQRLKDREEKFDTHTEESKKHLDRMQRKLDFTRHKEQPTPIEVESLVAEDTLYLYGVDYMNTFEIKKYFDGFGAEKEISWINDSSCRIKFESA